MYEIPSRQDIRKCIISAAVIRGEAKPEPYDEHGRPIGVPLDKAAWSQRPKPALDTKIELTILARLSPGPFIYPTTSCNATRAAS